MNTPNVPLLRKTVEWVEAEAAKPNKIDCQWVQRYWVSNPYQHALQIALLQAPADENGFSILARAKELEPVCGTAYCAAGYVGQLLDERYAHRETVDDVPVREFARGALGLSEQDACDLFRASNTPEDIRRIAERVAGESL